jgi:hypothetical protein
MKKKTKEVKKLNIKMGAKVEDRKIWPKFPPLPPPPYLNLHLSLPLFLFLGCYAQWKDLY